MNHVPHLIRVGLEIVEFVHSFEFEVVNVFPALVVNNPSANVRTWKTLFD